MKSVKYLLFDTLIVDKRFRGKKLSNLIMDFNNNIIKQSGFFSFLICKKELISFYKKFGWIKIKNKNIVVRDHSFSTYGMTYNQKYFNNKKEKFWELTYFLDRKKKTMSLGHFISEVRGTDTITKEMINLVKEHKNKRKTRWLTDPKTSRFLNFYVKP